MSQKSFRWNFLTTKKESFPFSSNQQFHTLFDENSLLSSTHILSVGILQNVNKLSISAQPFTDSLATAAMFENLPFTS